MSIKNTELRKDSANDAMNFNEGMRWFAKLRLVAVAGLIFGTAVVRGQRPLPPPQPIEHKMGTAPLTVDPREDQSPQYQQMKEQRNALRQRKLIEKTQELQRLSDELRAEVAKTDKDTLSIDVIKKSEKIEKLAKSIHELLATPL